MGRQHRLAFAFLRWRQAACFRRWSGRFWARYGSDLRCFWILSSMGRVLHRKMQNCLTGEVRGSKRKGIERSFLGGTRGLWHGENPKHGRAKSLQRARAETLSVRGIRHRLGGRCWGGVRCSDVWRMARPERHAGQLLLPITRIIISYFRHSAFCFKPSA
jgi:hypothetical protein